MMSARSRSPMSLKRRDEAVSWVDLWGFYTMQQQVHLGKQIRERLCLPAEDAFFLQDSSVLNRFGLLTEMAEGFHEKSASTARRVQNRFAQARICDFDHEFNDRARRVELARIASGVPHLFQHRFVEMAQCVDLFG